MNKAYWSVLFCALALIACGDGGSDPDKGTPQSTSLAIAGTWFDGYQEDPLNPVADVISNTTWRTQWGTQNIVWYDNAKHQLAVESDWEINTYNVIAWTWDSTGKLYYCTAVFGVESVEATHTAHLAYDDSNLLSGCGELKFPWSTLTPAP